MVNIESKKKNYVHLFCEKVARADSAVGLSRGGMEEAWVHSYFWFPKGLIYILGVKWEKKQTQST